MTSIRLSTHQMMSQGISNLIGKQADLARIQQQLTTGQKLTQAKDDPRAAAGTQRIDQALSAIDQFDKSSNIVQQRLEMQDTALADVTDVIRRAYELSINAGNATLSDTDRGAIASELRTLREALIGIGNRSDGDGRALFAGTQAGVSPFIVDGSAVTYVGNAGQNQIDVGAHQAVRDSDAGSDVFMNIRTGNGRTQAVAAGGNAGTGILAASVLNYGQWGGATLQLRFTSASDYEVVDGGGNPLAPPVTGTGWTSGQQIQAQGVQFSISGAPVAGDSFTLQPSATQDLFATLQQFADAMETPAQDATAAAARRNQLNELQATLSGAQDHMSRIRADTGARLSALDTASDSRSADYLSLKDARSKLADTDYNKVVSDMAVAQTAYMAAQQTILQMRGMSLFDKM